MPPGTPNTRLIRSGGGRTPSSSQRTALTTWPTSKASTSSAIPAAVARSMIPRPAGGGVMKVSSPKFIEPDSTPEMSGCASRPGGPLLDRHVVAAAGGHHREQVAARADPLDHVLEQLGAPARRAVVLAHVQVHDGGSGRAPPRSLESAISAVVYGMLGLFSRKTSAPVTATVTHDGVAVPSGHAGSLSGSARDARSSSVIGREPALLGVPEHEAELRLDHDLPVVVEDALAGADAGAAELAQARTAPSPSSSAGSISRWKLTEQRPTTYSSRRIPWLSAKRRVPPRDR